jgi:hypothetical protein
MTEVMKLCRLCLLPEKGEKFTSLFDIKGKYAEKVLRLAGILVKFVCFLKMYQLQLSLLFLGKRE